MDLEDDVELERLELDYPILGGIIAYAAFLGEDLDAESKITVGALLRFAFVSGRASVFEERLRNAG